VILPQLPIEAQTVVNCEFGAISLALAITAMVMPKNKYNSKTVLLGTASEALQTVDT
jgi:hypothetical protein